MTALTVYLSNVATSTLSTAASLASTTGGTIAGDSSLIGTSTGWGEVYGLGNSGAWAAAGSIGSPSGNGWLWDVTTLEAKTISAGTWSSTVRIRFSNGTGTVNVSTRFYKRSSGGTYTSIGTCSTTGVAMTTGYTQQTFTASLSSMEFNTGDKLYMDCWLNITSNSSGSGSAVVFITVTTSATQGDTTGAQVTPGYVATTRALSTTINGVGTLSPTLSAKTALSKTIHGVGTLTLSTITLKTSLSKTIHGVGTLTGTMSTTFGATIHGVGTLTGTMHVTWTDTLAGVGTLTATMSIAWHASVTFRGVGTLSGALPAFLYATLAGKSTFIPRMVAGGPGIVVQIDGNPVFIIRGTLQIQLAIGRRSTASFKVFTDTTVHFQQYQAVYIYYNGVTVFSGYLSNPKETKVGFNAYLIHDIQCVDQHWLADKRVIAASYTQNTTGGIVKQILANYLAVEGVTAGGIVDLGQYPSPTLFPGPDVYPDPQLQQIPNATFVYATVANVLDKLASQSQASGTPFFWQIDQYKQLWFAPYFYYPSNLVIDGTQIEMGHSPPVVDRQNPLYRNTQYVLGGTAQTITQVEKRVGDGVSTSWAMGFQLSSLLSITLDGSNKTFGAKGINTGKDFYWQQGSETITQDSSGTKLTSSNTLTITYIGQYPTVIISQDLNLVTTEQIVEGGGNSGVVESVENDTSLTTQQQGYTLASNLVARYGMNGTQLNFFTLQQGFQPGQYSLVNLPMFNIINQNMLIESVQITDNVDQINLWYNVNAVLGPYDATWVSFFGNLIEAAQQPSILNVGVGQTLNLAVHAYANLTLSAICKIVSNTPPNPNTTLYPSQTLYP